MVGRRGGRAAQRPGQASQLRIERAGKAETTWLDLAERAGLERVRRRAADRLVGSRAPRLRATLGIPKATSPAVLAGLRSGDRVTAVAGQPSKTGSSSTRRTPRSGSGGRCALTIERGPGGAPETRDASEVPALGTPWRRLGVQPASVLVSRVSPDSPAAKAGLAPGDLLLAVDERRSGASRPSRRWCARAAARRCVSPTRATARPQASDVAPEPCWKRTLDSAFPEPRYLIGVTAEAPALLGAVGRDVERNPLRVGAARESEMTGDVTKTFLARASASSSPARSRASSSPGPIGIAEIAHNAMQRGWEAYLSMLVLISINLGVLNLLPIPVLDGGQALLFLIEGVKRSPVSLRTREIVQQLGVTVLGATDGLRVLERPVASSATGRRSWSGCASSTGL